MPLALHIGHDIHLVSLCRLSLVPNSTRERLLDSHSMDIVPNTHRSCYAIILFIMMKLYILTLSTQHSQLGRNDVETFEE